MNMGHTGNFPMQGFDHNGHSFVYHGQPPARALTTPPSAYHGGLQQKTGEINHHVGPSPPSYPLQAMVRPEGIPRPELFTPTLPEYSPAVFVDGGEIPRPLDTDTTHYKPTFKTNAHGVVSHDPILNQDADALERFIIEHGCAHPVAYYSFHGTHTERRQRTVYQNGRSTTQHYTVTVVDFSFLVNLTPLLMPGPRLCTVPDEVPAYRGEMYKTREPDGPVDLRRRVKAESEEKDDEKHWEYVRTNRGYPPWVSRLPTPAGTENSGALQWGEPMRSGRNIKEWVVDYCQSSKIHKDFKFEKMVYGWDRSNLYTALKSIIRMHYGTDIYINFNVAKNHVHIMPATRLARIFSSTIAKVLLSLILVYPILWLWRRFWPDAGGKWDTCGAAFALKRWELATGTYPGETIDQARWRLSSNGVWGAQIPQILREGPGGVWALKGTSEGDWFRLWAARIQRAVIAREKHGSFIHLEGDWTMQVGNALDGHGTGLLLA